MTTYDPKTHGTRMSKTRGGWEAKTTVSLGPCKYDGEDAERVLTLTTSKMSRGVCSFATASVVRQNGFQTFMVFGDYAHTIKHLSVSRATEQAIRAAHDDALVQLPALVQAAHAFYAAKVA